MWGKLCGNQGGRKKFTTRNPATLETKGQTNSHPIWETTKSAKPKVSSRDCCRGLKDGGSGATTVKTQSQPLKEVPWFPWGSVWMGVSPPPSSAVTFSLCPLFRLMKIWLFAALCLVRANSGLSPETRCSVCHQVPSQSPSKARWQVAVVFQSDSEMVIHTFIEARLDSCNSLLAGFPKRALHKLQMVWNVAGRIWVKKGRYHPCC